MAGRKIVGLPPQPHPVLLRAPHEYLDTEDRIARNRREIHLLISDHHEMTATHATLTEDLSLSDRKLRDLADTAHKVKKERETQVKELYERSLAVEDEVKGIEALQNELTQVVAYVHKLTDNNIQLTAQFKEISCELEKVNIDAGELPELKAHLRDMRQEIHKGRAAIEYEKKIRAANVEEYQTMEKHMNSMQNQIEKLRAELAHAEKRARAAAAAASNTSTGYLGGYGSPNMGFGGGPYSAPYSMHQAVNIADGASPSLYRRPSGEHDQVDLHPHVPKR